MTEKSFPALRACVDLLSYNDNDLVRDARAELKAMDELLEAHFGPLPPCEHDMVGDEDICDGCQFIREKRIAARTESLLTEKGQARKRDE